MKILYIITLLTLSSGAMALTTGCEPIDPTCGTPTPTPPTAVPEPGTLMLMGVGLLAGFGFMRKK